MLHPYYGLTACGLKEHVCVYVRVCVCVHRRELRTLSEGEFTVNMLRSGWPQQFVTGIKTSWVGLVGATGDWGGLYSAMSAEPTGEALAGLLNRALSGMRPNTHAHAHTG